MNTPLRIAWLVPCYNEALTIGDVVAEIRSSCPESEIYVYDNGSQDQTAKIAAAAGATVRKELRKGKGSVVRSLFRDVEADIYLMLDGDLTYDAGSWRQMIAPILNGDADMVVGARLQSNDNAAFRRFHMFGNHVISGLIANLFGIKVKDVLSGYRAFSRRFVKDISIEAFGFEIETELTVKAIEHRFAIAEIDLPYRARPENSFSKLKTVEDGCLILLAIIRLFKDHKPLSFGCVVAMISALLAGVSFYLGWERSGNLFTNTIPVAIFGGLLLNAVSQRSNEITQVIVKARDNTDRLDQHLRHASDLGAEQEQVWRKKA